MGRKKIEIKYIKDERLRKVIQNTLRLLLIKERKDY